MKVDIWAGTDGYLDAWMDFTRDGDWDDREEQIVSQKVAAGFTRFAVPVPCYVTTPGRFVSRWRFSESGGLSYTGAGGKGEVEDYVTDWEPDPCPGLAESSIDVAVLRHPLGGISLEWRSVAGGSYRIESTADPAAGLWTILESVPGTGAGVTVAIDADSTAQFYRVVAVCNPVRLGSWGQRIWSSDLGSAWQDDTANYVAALWASGQNFCIYDVDHEACDGNLPNWENFKALLEALKGTDFHVFAAIGAPHLEGWTRWHPQSGSCMWTNCACAFDATTWDYGAYYACQANCLRYWINAWTNIAQTLSQLSLSYPNLVGLVFNDLENYLESADYPACIFGDRMTYAQVQEIADAVHSRNPCFGFWPTLYYSFASYLSDGFILGANYGTSLIKDEEMSVTFEFVVTAPLPSAELSFLHSDSVTLDSYGLYLDKEVEVNGVTVYAAPVAGNQTHEFFSTNITSLLSGASTNRITLRLRATDTEADSSCYGKFWYIWRPLVHVPKGGGVVALPFISTNFARNPLNLDYTSKAGCEWGVTGTNRISNTDRRSTSSLGCSTLPDDPVLGYMAGRLVAAPTGRFSIRPLVDGVVAPYYVTDAPGYSAGVFGRLLDGAVAELRGKKLMALELGQEFHGVPALDPAGLTEQLHLAAAKAQYTGLWEMPVGLQGLNRTDPDRSLGIFAPRSSDLAAYGFVAYWPWQSAVRGWYQRWRSTPSLKGRNLKVTVYYDERDQSADKEFNVKVYIDKGTAGIESLLDTAIGGASATAEIKISGLTDTLVLAAEIGLTWTSEARVYFNVEDTDAATADLGPDSGYWTYETGVSTQTSRSYDIEKRVFLQLR
jgi:hypothetical protein